jgi:hypothetical protein
MHWPYSMLARKVQIASFLLISPINTQLNSPRSESAKLRLEFGNITLESDSTSNSPNTILDHYKYVSFRVRPLLNSADLDANLRC